jgi:hypothetical protein
LGARTWRSDRPAAEPQLSEVRARLKGEGWAVRSDDVTAVVLAKGFDGRMAEIELVKLVGAADRPVIVSLTMPALFCGL